MKVLASVPTGTDPRDHFLILDCLHWTIAAAGYSFGDGYPCPRCAETPLAVSERSASAIAEFSEWSLANAELPTLDKREQARSYAVEALWSLLRDNPGSFDYQARWNAIRDARAAGNA